ncbi:hypothetical protein [Lactobacillus sp. PSON]|uniref:hypothetical protein n=1 Tax=Lactobacillus sp. PSON TaxID=3455454 RepID=UPI004041131B
MSLKDEWQDTKRVFKQYKSDWKKESAQKLPARKKKIIIWLFSVLAVGILILPWLNLKNVAYFLDAVVAFLLVDDGYPLAYVFGRRGMSRIFSLILSLLIGLVIIIIAGVYIFVTPDVFK